MPCGEEHRPANRSRWTRFVLNQVRDLPEQLVAGRFHILQDWMFNYLLKDSDSIGPRDRAIYAAAYARTPSALETGASSNASFSGVSG